MSDPVPSRFTQDKTIVIAIVKYLLITIILVAVGYVSVRLLVILIPFILGFILAKTSSSIAFRIMVVTRGLRKRHRGKAVESVVADLLSLEAPDDPDGEHEKDEDPETHIFTKPAARKRAKRTKKSPATVLSLVVFSILLLFVLGLIVTVVFIGAAQVKNLVDKLPSILSADNMQKIMDSLYGFSEKLGGFLPAASISALENELLGLQQLALNQVPAVATAILNVILNMLAGMPVYFFWVVVVIASGFYFLTDKKKVRKFLKRNIPSESFISNVVQLSNRLFSTLFRTIGGFILLLFITYLLALISFLIIDVPYAVILAVVAAVLDFLPVLGLSVTFIPVAVYLAVTGNLVGAVVAILCLVAMTVIRRMIEPAILGSALRIHPIATLFAMIVGFGFFGLAGFLIGPILLVTTQETMRQFEFDRKLRVWVGKLLDKLAT